MFIPDSLVSHYNGRKCKLYKAEHSHLINGVYFVVIIQKKNLLRNVNSPILNSITKIRVAHMDLLDKEIKSPACPIFTFSPLFCSALRILASKGEGQKQCCQGGSRKVCVQKLEFCHYKLA